VLTIDETKCEKDGICAAVCPTQIIFLNNGNGMPQIKPGAEQMCLSCGHCVSACPHGALTHDSVDMYESPPIKKELNINLEQTTQFLRSRRSIRNFSGRAVEKDKIQALIEIARYAPTGSNLQLLEWIVIQDPAQIRALLDDTVTWMKGLIQKGPNALFSPYIVPVIRVWDEGYDMILRNTPVLVIAAAPNDADFGMVDVLLALSYLELAAPKFKMGGCWAGLLHHALRRHQPLRDLVGLTERLPHYFPMMLGYPKFKFHRLVERRPPKISWK